MDEFLKKSWWMFALRGVLALTFGTLAIFVSGETLLVLVVLFFAWMLIGGGVSIYAAIKNLRTGNDWWIALLLGVTSLMTGAIAVFEPGITVLVLVLVMGANALFTGVIEIIFAVRARTAIEGEWLLYLAGGSTVAFGVLVFLIPTAGALASFYAVFTGTLLMMLAFHARAAPARAALDRARRPLLTFR